MKKAVKLFGIIALVAVIGVWMTACDDNDEFDNGDNREQVTITFSIDKIDAETFTITAEGANWNSSVGNWGWSGNADVFDPNQRTLSATNTTNNMSGTGVGFQFFDTTRSGSLLTCTLNDSYSNVSGTLALNPYTMSLGVACDVDWNKNNTFVINPAKSSITF